MKGNPLYILLWLFLILCFACSPGKKEKKYVIGVSQCSMTDIWRQSMIRDMEVEALNRRMRPSLLRLSLLRRTGLVFPLSYWTGKLIAMNIRRILERIITRSVVRSECTSAP